MPKAKRFYQDEIHKNVIRGRFLRSVSQVTGEKLRDLLNQHKAKKEADRE
ncbi:DUF2740 family protein [Franconibacter sp. IITDAS19]|nr:DUF2740 family protein [Franconibacter sp. IITDAS19]MCK1966837.1 DUF2740 family protein [Franconibacter sp. IITDAS19]